MVATDCPVLDDETDALAHKLRVCPKHHLVEQFHCKVELLLQAPSQKEERVGDMTYKFQVSQQRAACTCTCRKYYDGEEETGECA